MIFYQVIQDIAVEDVSYLEIRVAQALDVAAGKGAYGEF